MQVPIGVLQTWFERSCELQICPVPGGLSSSRVWRIVSQKGTHCLKAWPMDAGRIQRLAEIHGRLRELQVNGIHFVPQILATVDGTTWLQTTNHLWEVYSWMPGHVAQSSSDAEKLLPRAVSAVARIHDVWQRHSSYLAASPGVAQRIQSLQQFFHCQPQLVNSQAGCQTLERLSERTLSYLHQHGRSLIVQLMDLMMPTTVHFAIRDLHYEHILYLDGQVSGIIDFGAAREDEPLIDLVRLTGSAAPLNREARYQALNRYLHQRRSLEISAVPNCYELPEAQDDEIHHRFAILDQASTLISALNWWQWLVVEARQFHAPQERLIARWQNLVGRLECGQW